jgi:hypothetical protein
VGQLVSVESKNKSSSSIPLAQNSEVDQLVSRDSNNSSSSSDLVVGVPVAWFGLPEGLCMARTYSDSIARFNDTKCVPLCASMNALHIFEHGATNCYHRRRYQRFSDSASQHGN